MLSVSKIKINKNLKNEDDEKPSLRQFIFFRKCLSGTSSLPATVNLRQRLHSCLFRYPMERDNFFLANHKGKYILGVKDLNKAS